MSKLALGIIETIGLAAAIEAADVAAKSANVHIIGYELTKGNGMATVKIEGNVSAVKAAIHAATMSAQKVNKVWGSIVIARPSDGLGGMIYNHETVGINKIPKQDVKIEQLPKEKIDSNLKQKSTQDKKSTEDKKVESKSSNEEKIEEDKKKDLLTMKENKDHEESLPVLQEDKKHMDDTKKDTLEEKSHEELEDKKIDEDKMQEKQDQEREEDSEVCNICKDPKCPRKKGDLRKMCIHYERLKKEGRLDE